MHGLSSVAASGDGRADPLGERIMLMDSHAISESRLDRNWKYVDRIPAKTAFVLLSATINAVVLILGVYSLAPNNWVRQERLETVSQLPPAPSRELQPLSTGPVGPVSVLVAVATIPNPTEEEQIMSLLDDHGIRCDSAGLSHTLYVSPQDAALARRLIAENFPSVKLLP